MDSKDFFSGLKNSADNSKDLFDSTETFVRLKTAGINKALADNPDAASIGTGTLAGAAAGALMPGGGGGYGRLLRAGVGAGLGAISSPVLLKKHFVDASRSHYMSHPNETPGFKVAPLVVRDRAIANIANKQTEAIQKGQMKVAAFKETMKQLGNAVVNYGKNTSTYKTMSDKRSWIPVALAGGLGALWAYQSSRPRQELGGKSSAEVEAHGAVKAQQSHNEEGAGLLRKLKNRTVESTEGVAKALREHHGKATAIGALLGAGGGMQFARRVLKAGVK